jgi:hypothetical protein
MLTAGVIDADEKGLLSWHVRHCEIWRLEIGDCQGIDKIAEDKVL